MTLHYMGNWIPHFHSGLSSWSKQKKAQQNSGHMFFRSTVLLDWHLYDYFWCVCTMFSIIHSNTITYAVSWGHDQFANAIIKGHLTSSLKIARRTPFGNYQLTYWGWNKMAAILQLIFSNAFSWMGIFVCNFNKRVKEVCSQWFIW